MMAVETAHHWLLQSHCSCYVGRCPKACRYILITRLPIFCKA
jgi:hypothetical protein